MTATVWNEHSCQSSEENGERTIRVLIVDDSVVIRRLLSETLSTESDLEVVGTASSANVALQRIIQLQPDIITLDVELPDMNGLELLTILHRDFPKLRVLLFTGCAESLCVNALLEGASDYIIKPSNVHSFDEAIERIRPELGSKLRQPFRRGKTSAHSVKRSLTHFSAEQPASPDPDTVSPLSQKQSGWPIQRKTPRPEILAIGSSTGGPTALTTLIQGLPLNFPLPVVIVQHMPPVFTRLLAERIQTRTGFTIVEAEDGMLLQPGKAFLAPGNFHMRLERAGTNICVRLDQREMECSCRPSVDVLFRSVHQVFGGAAIVAMLTGMGKDGLQGTAALAGEGAHVIAQDEASSTVWGMPGAIVSAGLAHEVLNVDGIASAIVQQAGRSFQ